MNQRQMVSKADIFGALLLMTVVWILYQVNGTVLPSNDVTVNVELPANVWERRSVVFFPQDHPSMFVWRSGEDQYNVWYWEAAAPDGRSWRDWQQHGQLEVANSRYYLARSTDPARRGYVSTYGVGAGMIALPIFVLGNTIDPDFWQSRSAKWMAGKWVASACVALSVGLIFLMASPLVGRWLSAVIALTFGLATNVWSMTSQSLWQAAPSVLFITLAIYCLPRMQRHRAWAVMCGVATGCAVVCRESAVLFAAAVAGHLLVCMWLQRDPGVAWFRRRAWRTFVGYVLGGLPFVLALGFYHWYYLGSPFTLAKTQAALWFAESKMGNPNLWQTPFVIGFAGLLVSPSRGVLVYSPVLVFAIGGAVLVWKRKRYASFRPLTVVALLLIAMYAKYFDWHSGWSFGSRYTTDILPMLAVCSVAIAKPLARNKRWKILFGLALAWSLFVQVLGAFAYNMVGWNNRPGYVLVDASGQAVQLLIDHETAQLQAKVAGHQIRTVGMNVDLKPFRHRLWSICDSQLMYYVTHFSAARNKKLRDARRWLMEYDAVVPQGDVGTEEDDRPGLDAGSVDQAQPLK